MARQKLSKELILKKIKELHKQGKSLHPIDIDSIYQTATKYFGSYQKALKKVGLSYQMLGIRECSRKWNREKIIKKLKELHRQGKPLNPQYMEKHHLAVKHAAARYFGSYKKAIESIGLDYRQIRQCDDLQGWIKSLSNRDVENLSKKIKRLYSKRR